MSNSDYKKNNTNFYDFLPEIYKNDYTKSLFNNLFNRYVTKDELTYVDGYIGEGNPNAIINRKIKEISAHRQAFQLQPVLYSKLGTVEHMMSWKDILNEMNKIGIDTNNLKEWLTPQKFNWVPPIDIDKLLHYRDYYWYNPDEPNDTPQYITIKNICNAVESKVKLYEKILSNNGSEFPIAGLTSNSILINNDVSSIFSKDFIFYTKNSINPDINNTFWTVDYVEFNINLNKTQIFINETINNTTVISGILSLNEFLEVLIIERDCICNGIIGFDKTLFDDNQLGTIVWNTNLINTISYNTLNDWILAGNDPSIYDLWYDTSTNTLKQYNKNQATETNTDHTLESNWKTIHNNFSSILSQTEGSHFWDLSTNCEYSRNEWVDQNKWLHKSVIPNFSIAKQAEIPIIEYLPYLELNEWTKITHQWKYRPNIFSDFEISDKNPSLFELIEIDNYKLEPNIIKLNSRYGDLTDTFNPNYEFNIINSVGAVYPITNIITGLGGSFIVLGNILNEYTTINDSLNPNQLPHIFKIRNSPGGILDKEWTIESIDTLSQPGKSIITVISTESINTFSFTGSEIYQTNNGEYTTSYSEYLLTKSSFQLIGLPNYNTNQITILGDIQKDKDFTDYFYTNQGVFEYSIISYDSNTNQTILQVKETLPTNSFTEIFIEEFRTIIHIQESFNLYNSISSKLLPKKSKFDDIWIGYNKHWVYNNIESVTPISRQNILPGLLLNKPIQIVDESYGITTTYSNNDFEYKVNRFIQYYLVKKIGGISKFEFHKSLYNKALVDSDSIRVYVKTLNDNQFIRQYGNYNEIDTNGYVSGIEFNSLSPLPRYTEIKIEVGPAVIEDIGFELINVRTEESDDLYNNDPISYSNNVKLYQFNKNEQIKTDTNQYPLFDIYDTNGDSLLKISKMFYFKESSNYEINFSIGKRIINNNLDFTFEQDLIDESTSELYTYRDNNTNHHIFYVNSNTNQVFIWNNFTWNLKLLSNNRYLKPIVRNTEPTELYETFENQLWYNPLSKELYLHNGLLFESVQFDYGTIDPTLKTIWQPGLNNESYEPKYVDKDKNEIAINDINGEWEIPDPLYYNVHHENRKEISLLYLTAHFNSIINSQKTIPGFNDSANNTFHINLNPNYGLGGTIREYNDGFDILLSSLFLDNSTTNKLLDFAQNQYSNSLISISEILNKNIYVKLQDLSYTNNEDILVDLINESILEYENNDNTDQLYYDSLSYNEEAGLGIRNWISTLPMFELFDKHKPYIIDESQYLIKHHDGHISQSKLIDSIRENIIVRLLKTSDVRVNAGSFLGNSKLQYSSLPPNTTNELFTKFNSTKVVNGKYWYHISGKSRTLYRLNLAVVSGIQPGIGYNENSYWYDTASNTLYILQSGSWNIVTSYGDSIISSAWEILNLNQIKTKLTLEIENRLYNSLKDEINTKININDFNSLSGYSNIELSIFNEYARSKGLVNPMSQIGIFDNTDAFTWNYKNSSNIDIPYSGYTLGTGGCWQDLYEKVYGTAYPHREPWILQEYKQKPLWWDNEYKDLSGNRYWLYNHTTTSGMWDNILKGIVPAGYLLPDNTVSSGNIGEVKQYSHLSIMIDDNQIGNYKSDDLLPPYWNYKPYLGNSYNGPIKSLYHDFNTQIIKTNLDFKFGDKGTQEWIWNHSIEYRYDLLKIYFRLNPLEFYHKTFGIEYNIINGLQIDRNFKKVYSHKNSIFHGDIYNEDQIYLISGINQWYTNYNRYFVIDSNISTFKSLWNNWDTPLIYQMSTFIDTESLDIQNKNFDLIDNDLDISIKKSLGLQESWLDSINISVIKIPNVKISYNSSYKWLFNIFGNISKNFNYYGVKNYPITIESDNTCSIYKFKIITIDSIDNLITIKGDWTHIFGDFSISNSSLNDGQYTIDSVIYNTNTNITIIKPNEILDDNIVDGYIKSNFTSISWKTGQEVVFESTELLPRPLIQNETYYIIRINNQSFKLAETSLDAKNGNYIEFLNLGQGELFVGQLKSTFNALSKLNNSNIWKQYEIDKSIILSFNLNKLVYGIQNIINIINGYEQYLTDENWVFNYENSDVDPILGRSITWQYEVEKFINELSIIQNSKQSFNDTYEFQSINRILQFTTEIPSWITGTRIQVSSSDLPEPLISSSYYYIIKYENTNEFALADTLTDAKNNNPIGILSDGNISVIQQYSSNQSIYVFEINPFKNNVWYKNDIGIIADIFTGPYKDISVDNTIYDQNGNVLNSNDVSIYREDSISKILLHNPSQNINDKHISGFHIFVNGYEHIIKFANYTKEGFLIYDPFIGLNTGRFDLTFNKQDTSSLRPNIGGRFFQNSKEFISNLESLTKNLEEAYSTYSTSESNKMTQLARLSLGYNKTEQSFLDNLTINDKSQFIFWKGLLQHKGSVNTIAAFINSRRFIDAKLDEYWCYKIGEFGDSKTKQSYELKLNIKDSLSHELKFEFNENTELPTQSFYSILLSDSSRWYDYPSQANLLNKKFKSHFYFNAEISEIYPNENGTFNTIYNVDGSPIDHKGTLWFTNGSYFFKANSFFDSVIISYENNNSKVQLVENTHYTIINSKIIQFNDDPNTYSNLLIMLLNVAKSKHSPLKIIDYKSNIKFLDIPIWDPAKNHNYHITEHLIDFKSDTDIAKYTDYINPSLSGNELKPWDKSHKNKIWLDTSLLDYIPYYDKAIIPSTIDRIRNWGALSDYATVEVYQWTESDIPPEEWNTIAETEQNDKSISDHKRKTGTIKECVYNVGENKYEKTIKWYEQYHILNSDTSFLIDTISVNNIIPNQVYNYIESIKPKYDLKSYINGLYDSTTQILPNFGYRVIDYGNTIIGTSLINLISGTYKFMYKDTGLDLEEIQISILGTETYNDLLVLINNQLTNSFVYIDNGNLKFELNSINNIDYIEVSEGDNNDLLSALPNYNLVDNFTNIDIEISFNGSINNHDLKTIIWFAYDKTDESGTRIYPTQDELDSGDYIIDIPYSKIITKNKDFSDKITYYFWVKNKTIKEQNLLSLVEIKNDMINIPVPYAIIQNFKSMTLDMTNMTLDMPNRYNQLIINKLSKRINEDNRYMLKIIHDFTLRDDYEDGISSHNLKTTHTEWKLFRKSQPYHIDRYLWDRVIESVLEKTLNGLNRIPTLDKELYDIENGTTTRYGLGKNRLFLDKNEIIDAIYDDLYNPNNDFYPVDIDSFIQNNNFDTEESSYKFLNDLYNTFASEHINRIYFTILHIAFSKKLDYDNIMKTSMISLHGIKILESKGIYDD